MIRELRPALVIFGLLTVITGLLYPGIVTLVGRVFFPDQAAGSIMMSKGQAVGSRLLGQSFSAAKYFWARPSATAPQPYHGGASGGSNLAATNPALVQAVRERVAALRTAERPAGASPAPVSPQDHYNTQNDRPVPVDLVTASASGLDPHISPAAAQYQIARVARARGLKDADVRKRVARATTGRTFGILGEPRVNVLELNLALDELK